MFDFLKPKTKELPEGVVSMYIKLRDTLQALGYKFYFQEHKLNIVGLRTLDMTPNVFNDLLFVAYLKESKMYCHQWKITTDPGLYWLKKPLNVNGTAILVPGQYLDTYSIDLHQGKYKALCQRLKPVKVYRDNNKDDRYDFNDATIETGLFGINIHRAKEKTLSFRVDKFSAGCQVFANSADFEQFMILAELHKKHHGNSFTYTLLQETI